MTVARISAASNHHPAGSLNGPVVNPEGDAKMAERREYEMTEADLAKILEACKPVPLIALNAAIAAARKELGNG